MVVEATAAAEEATLEAGTMTDEEAVTTTTIATTLEEGGTTMTGVADVTTGTMTTTVTIRMTVIEGIGGEIRLTMRLGSCCSDNADRRGFFFRFFVDVYRDRYERRDRSPPRRREYYE